MENVGLNVVLRSASWKRKRTSYLEFSRLFVENGFIAQKIRRGKHLHTYIYIYVCDIQKLNSNNDHLCIILQQIIYRRLLWLGYFSCSHGPFF